MDSVLLLFDTFQMDRVDILMFMMAAFLLGMAKAGVKGLGTISIPLTVFVFGAKESTGIILPVLIYADSFSVLYYYKKTDWSQVKMLIPMTIIGVVLATLVGYYISGKTFQYAMGFLILICLLLLIVKDKIGNNIEMENHSWLTPLTGVSLGFTTMIGNAAGPFLNIYLLIRKMPKETFVATSAVYFYIVNFIKIPFHVFGWKTITWDTFMLSLTTIPIVIVGVLIGIQLVKLMNETFFKWLVIISTAVSGIILLIR